MAAEIDYAYLAKLVARTQMGDSDAFATLYAATYRQQYQFAYTYLRDEFLAQDAIQELYILVFKNIHKLHDSNVFMDWLNQINFRICFKIARRQKEDNCNIISDSIKQVERQVENDFILHQIMELSPYETQVILLKYYHAMKLTDIAEMLGISKRIVRRHLRNGRYKLKRVLNR